jgi:hypothetical protein
MNSPGITIDLEAEIADLPSQKRLKHSDRAALPDAPRTRKNAPSA